MYRYIKNILPGEKLKMSNLGALLDVKPALDQLTVQQVLARNFHLENLIRNFNSVVDPD